MSLSLLDFLRHILDECDYILEVTRGKGKDQVLDDPTLQRSIIRSIEIIGEAAKKLDDDFRSSYPAVEWRKIAKARDKMIHHYFGIDYEIVWDIIQHKIPDLQQYTKQIIEERSGDNQV